LYLFFQATDRDLGPNNNKIVYSITGGDPQKNFTIDPNTGIIGLKAPLDIEHMDPSLKYKYNLTVTATDKGTPPLRNSVHVVITVQVIHLIDSILVMLVLSI
jgi:hypothetical protein